MAVGELGEERRGVEKGCGVRERKGGEGCSGGSNGKDYKRKSMPVHIQQFQLL